MRWILLKLYKEHIFPNYKEILTYSKLLTLPGKIMQKEEINTRIYNHRNRQKATENYK